MLEILRDDLGNIICACEWRRVLSSGEYNKDGKYIYIANVEVSKQYEHTGLLRKLTQAVIDKFPDFEYAYFKRSKYNKRIRGYTRKQWLNLIKEKKYEYALA